MAVRFGCAIISRTWLEAIPNIDSYTSGLNQPVFLSDRKIQDAVIRNIEVIGEACKEYQTPISL